MTVEGTGSGAALEGGTIAKVFLAYVEQILAPTLKEERVVVMNNLQTLKSERVREMIEARGCSSRHPTAFIETIELTA